MYQSTANIIIKLVGNEILYFDTELKIKVTPHTPAFHGWAVCVSPANGIYLMDGEQEWHYVEKNDAIVLNSLYQRMRVIERRYVGEVINEPKAA